MSDNQDIFDINKLRRKAIWKWNELSIKMTARIFSILILAFLFVTSPYQSVADDSKPLILKAITFQGKNVTFTDAFFMFQERVSKQSQGKVKIQYIGGPEAIPAFDQIEAVKAGLVDIAYLPTAYYVPQMAEADAVKLTELTPWEERESGAYDYLNDLHQKKLNVYYLGRFTSGVKFHLYLTKEINKPSLKGMKIRVTPIYKPFVEALGGVPMTIAPGEVYTALERGVVDGYGWASIKISDFGWHEVTKYVVSPGFYQAEVGMVINLKTWKKLPQDIQELLIGITRELERDASDYYAKVIQEERNFILSKGVEIIRFSPDDEKRYLQKAYEAGWAHVIKKCPETGARFRELVKKPVSHD